MTIEPGWVAVGFGFISVVGVYTEARIKSLNRHSPPCKELLDVKGNVKEINATMKGIDSKIDAQGKFFEQVIRDFKEYVRNGKG